MELTTGITKNGRPRLACCNFLPEVGALKRFALKHGFDGVDWSFFPDTLPRSPSEESGLVRALAGLEPLEVRYHCAFRKMDLGDDDPSKAMEALKVFRRVCHLVSKLDARVLTIHIGLGRDTTTDLSWNRTVEHLADLVRFANDKGVRLCLENLAWGWTSRPHLYEKLIRKSGAWATLDIGHARVSPTIVSQQFALEDFVTPHPERFLNAHVYHEERKDRHMPPGNVADLEERLHLVKDLPLCDWWVLELREERTLLETLAVVNRFLQAGSALSSPK